ncbi:glycosyltransferase family 2 protein [Spirosoma pomorum]
MKEGLFCSVIIATYNADKTLEKSINSVLIQKKQVCLELIIIDGGSTDKTLDIIKKYQLEIDYWISEYDKGIYDAWNKGINASKGQWILFVGADDFLLPDALFSYYSFLKNSDKSIDYISSKALIVSEEGKGLWVNGDRWEWPKFLRKMMVAHPGSLHSKNIYIKYGLYNLHYKVVGDYELLLRAGNNLKAEYLNRITIEMTEGGASDSLNAVIEHFYASTKTGDANKLLTFFFCSYVFLKSRINKNFRKFGVNFNRRNNGLH